MDDLPAVENNLKRFAQLLQHADVWGLPAVNCLTLAQPSRDEFLGGVDDAASEAEDTILFYFSGHGLLDASGELYLALANSEPNKPYRSVRFEEVRRILLGDDSHAPIKAKRRVVILDCCWSGRALGGLMADGSNVAAKTNVSGSFVLTATAETRQALAPPGAEYTAFTGELLKLIEEGSASSSKLLTMSAVFEELTDRLGAKSMPIPQQRNRNSAGSICIFRNRGCKSAGNETEPAVKKIPVPTQEEPGSRRLPSQIRELKQSLHDPSRRIAVSELFVEEADKVASGLSDTSVFPLQHREDVGYLEVLRRYEERVSSLASLLAIAVFYDEEHKFSDLWVRVVQRLSAVRGIPGSSFSDAYEALRHYPALIATCSIGVAAVLSGREDLVARIMTEPVWSSPYGRSRDQSPFEYLNPVRILNAEALKSVNAPSGKLWIFPQSRYLRQALRAPIGEIESNDDNFKFAFDRFEMLTSVLCMGVEGADVEDNSFRLREYPWPGEFISRFGNAGRGGDLVKFAAEVKSYRPVGIARAFGNDRTRISEAIAKLQQWIDKTPGIF
jgi:hypothetical protein